MSAGIASLWWEWTTRTVYLSLQCRTATYLTRCSLQNSYSLCLISILGRWMCPFFSLPLSLFSSSSVFLYFLLYVCPFKPPLFFLFSISFLCSVYSFPSVLLSYLVCLHFWPHFSFSSSQFVSFPFMFSYLIGHFDIMVETAILYEHHIQCSIHVTRSLTVEPFLTKYHWTCVFLCQTYDSKCS